MLSYERQYQAIIDIFFPYFLGWSFTDRITHRFYNNR